MHQQQDVTKCTLIWWWLGNIIFTFYHCPVTFVKALLGKVSMLHNDASSLNFSFQRRENHSNEQGGGLSDTVLQITGLSEYF